MTKQLELTQGKVALVDDADYEWLSQFRWHARFTSGIWYAARSDGTQLHRLIMDPPAGMSVDHIDHDGLNNTRGNLRLATTSQNLGNQRVGKNNTSGYKGVSWHNGKQRWRVRVQERTVGHFRDKIDAAKFYNQKALEAWGPFAKLNPLPPSES